VSNIPRRTRRLTARGARRTILVGALVFVAVQAGVAVVVETRFPGWREAWFSSRVEHFMARQRAAPPATRTVLILGSSRTFYALRASLLEHTLSEKLGQPVSVFNYSTAGGGPVTALLQWRRLKEAGARPDLVIVDALPAMLNDTVPVLEAAIRHTPAAEMDWEDIAAIVHRDPSAADLYRENILGRLFPLYGHRQTFMTRLLPKLLPASYRRVSDDFLDAVEDGGQELRAQALPVARGQYQDALANFHLGARHTANLEDLLREFRACGIPTVALVTPEGPIFRSWYRSGAWTEVETWLESACRRQRVTLVNAQQWCDDESWYFDSHHLVSAGSEHVSSRLAHEVLLPLLANAGATDRIARK